MLNFEAQIKKDFKLETRHSSDISITELELINLITNMKFLEYRNLNKKIVRYY